MKYLLHHLGQSGTLWFPLNKESLERWAMKDLLGRANIKMQMLLQGASHWDLRRDRRICVSAVH